MNIDRRGNLRANRGKIKQGSGGDRERASRQFQMRLVSEDEDGSSGHAFGYEKARGADKHFRNRRRRAVATSVRNYSLPR